MPKKTKEQQDNRLEDLINILERKLAIIDEKKMKELCLQSIIEINSTIRELDEKFDKLNDLLGISWGDIN